MSDAELDLMLAEIGDCGVYQFGQYLLIGLVFVYSAASPIVYVFTAALVPHRCLVRECGDSDESSPFSPSWLSQAVPLDPDSGQPESCLQYTPTNSSLCNPDPNHVVACSEWVLKGPERTIQTAYDLMCEDNEWKMALVGTVNSLGVLVSVPIAGYIADRYGRKLGLVLTLVSSAVLALLKTAMPEYISFMVLEFLESVMSGGIYSIIFVLVLEHTTPKRRVILGDMTAAWFYSFGNIAVGLIAWGLRDWRYILWAINAPALLFISYIWLIPESIRWLVSVGRLGDAKKILLDTMKKNRSELSPESLEKLKLWENGSETEKNDDDESLWPSLKMVATSKILIIRLLICFFAWIVVTLVYSGLTLNSVNLAGTDDQYLNFILVSVADLPSILLSWVGMTQLGRQKTLCLTLVLSGIACFINPFVSEDASEARLALYLSGKVAIAATFGVVYMFTSEIFPTRLRTSLLGLCSMVGRIGSMLAPLTPLLTKYSNLLPLVPFGVLALIAGGLAFLLPETKGRPLPVNVLEAEQMGKMKKTEQT